MPALRFAALSGDASDAASSTRTAFDDAIARRPARSSTSGRRGAARARRSSRSSTELEARVPVAKLNIDEHPGIAARYDVLSIPTVILFAGGEPRGTVVGLRPRAHFEQWLAEVLPAAAGRRSTPDPSIAAPDRPRSRADPASRRAARSPRRSARSSTRRAVGERDGVEVDLEPAARALGDVPRVEAEAVGDVEHRVRDRGEATALLEPERRPQRAAPRGTPRPRAPSGPVTTSRSPGRAPARPGHALGAADRGDAQHDGVRARRVASAHGNAGLGDALRTARSHRRALGSREADDQRDRLGARRGEVAEVDRRGAKAELAPADEVEAEVDALDERVLRHDEPLDLRGVVLDADDEPAPLELGEELELPSQLLDARPRRRASPGRARTARRRAARGTCPARPRPRRRPPRRRRRRRAPPPRPRAARPASRRGSSRSARTTCSPSRSPSRAARVRSRSRARARRRRRGRRVRSPKRRRRAAAPRRERARPAPSRCSIDSTPRTSAAAPTSVAISPALPRSTVTSTTSRMRRAVVRPVRRSRRRRRDRARSGSAARVRGAAGEQHRLDPVLRERADVEHERGGDAHHLLHLLAGVRHHRQRAERERRVRRLVHDDVVRDLVDERLALAHRRAASCRQRSSLHLQDVDGAFSGTDLDETVLRPRATRRRPRRGPRRRGSRRARAARRASPSACSRRRASPRPSWRATGISTCSRRRRGGRPACSPWPPVTTTADAPSACSRSGELAPRRVDAGERLRLEQVRRHHRREREELGRRAPRRRRPRAASPPELATITGSTTSGTGCRREVVGDGLDRARARRASPSSPRRRRCRRRRPRAARARTPAAARGSPSPPACSAPSARRARTIPYTPAAANAFRSAWMPAPPPESDVAIVSARATIPLPTPV